MGVLGIGFLGVMPSAGENLSYCTYASEKYNFNTLKRERKREKEREREREKKKTHTHRK